MRNDVHFSIVYQCKNLETAELPNNRTLMYLWNSPIAKVVPQTRAVCLVHTA